MFPLLILLAAGAGLFVLARNKPPMLANGAINKTNKPTTLVAVGTFAPLANLPKGETVMVLGSGRVQRPASGMTPAIDYVFVNRQGGIPGLLPVADLAAI